MNTRDWLDEYWNAVATQNAEKLQEFFLSNARIRWHNTNEEFRVNEFVIANCEYPDSWDGKVEKFYQLDNTVISITHIWNKDKTMSFHVTSIFKIENKHIDTLDEYWGDDGNAPQWRLERNIGKPISASFLSST